MLSYVMQVSGQQQLYYVGHSQGTVMGFIGFTNQTLAKMAKRFYALAPVTTVKHVEGVLQFLAPIYKLLEVNIM